MIRLPSSFALAGWAGFHAVTALTQAAASLGRPTVFAMPIDGPAASGAEQLLLIALSMAATTLCGFALLRLHAADGRSVRAGEALAFVGVGVSLAFVLAAILFGAPMDHIVSRPDLALWAIGLTLVALAFDNCMFEADDPDDEMEFQRALRLVEGSIPRRAVEDGRTCAEDDR